MSSANVIGVQAGDEAKDSSHRYLASELAALPESFAQRTFFPEPLQDSWIEKSLRRLGSPGMAVRVKHVRGALRLWRLARYYDGIVTCGDLEGLAFALLQRFRGRRRCVHVMYDCLWYGGSRLKRACMKNCV